MPGSIRVTVSESELVAPAVRRLLLQRTDRAPLPPVRPGDHVRLARAAGPAVPVSIAGQPLASRYQILVADTADAGHPAGGRTPRLHETLTLEGPGNGMPLCGQPGAVRLIGAGLGIAPLLPLARALNARDCRVRLCWVGRGITSSQLRAELEAEFGHAVRFHDSRREGRPDLRAVLGRPAAGTQLYCAGPVAFIEALLCAADRLDWPLDALHWDRYLPVQLPPGLRRMHPGDSPAGPAALQSLRRS